MDDKRLKLVEVEIVIYSLKLNSLPFGEGGDTTLLIGVVFDR